MNPLQQKGAPSVKVVLSPALLEAYSDRPSVCIVIDILRASSTLITAFSHGVKEVIALETTDEAVHEARQGHWVGAERDCERCSFAHYGNDPLEYTSQEVLGKTIYFTTTNGTRTIKQCLSLGHEVLIGGFLNRSVIVEACQGKDVLCVCAGWKGRISLEDALFAGCLTDSFSPTHCIQDDASRIMQENWLTHRSRVIPYLQDCEHYRRLQSSGKANSFGYCLTLDSHSVLPRARYGKHGEILIRAD